MEEVTIYQAKTHLSRLLKQVAAGDTIIIKRGSRPVARLMPMETESTPRVWGQWKGQIQIADDFDEPLTDELMQHFLP